MSMNKIFASLKNLEVCWKGTNKNEKTGKERTSVQLISRSPDGAVTSFYAGGNGALEGLKPGDRIEEAEVSIRSWQGNLYVDIMRAQLATVAKGATK